MAIPYFVSISGNYVGNVTPPSGIQPGDLLIAYKPNALGSVTTPTGFTNINVTGLGVYYKYATNSEPANYGFSGSVLAFRGVAQSSPIEVAASENLNTTTPPSITTGQADDLVVFIGEWESSSGNTLSTLPGFTGRVLAGTFTDNALWCDTAGTSSLSSGTVLNPNWGFTWTGGIGTLINVSFAIKAAYTGTVPRQTQWLGSVYLRPDPRYIRVTQAYGEVIERPNPPMRVFQSYGEVIERPDPPARVFQAYGEVIERPDPQMRVFQSYGEVIEVPDVTMKVFQAYAEVIVK